MLSDIGFQVFVEGSDEHVLKCYILDDIFPSIFGTMKMLR